MTQVGIGRHATANLGVVMAAHLLEKIIDEWPLVHMVKCTPTAQHHLNRVPYALIPPAEAEQS